VKLCLRKRALVMLDQESQKIERLRGERYRVAGVQQHTAIGIERPRAKAEAQN